MLFSRKKTGKNNLPLNSTLYLKFILVYIILGFLSLFTASTLASGLTYSNLKSSEADRLYAEATAMANDYLPGYFSELLSGSEVKMQLNGLSSYADAAVWLVDREVSRPTEAGLLGMVSSRVRPMKMAAAIITRVMGTATPVF